MGGADDYRIVALNLEASPRTGKHVFGFQADAVRLSRNVALGECGRIAGLLSTGP